MFMFLKFRTFCEQHFGVVLFVALLCALMFPPVGALSGVAVPLVLGVIMYFASSKIMAQDIPDIEPFSVFKLYFVRFIILPVLVFFIAGVVLPDYRFSLLLLLLLPTGATLPAIVAIMGGNPALGLGMTCFTNLLVPIVLPAIFLFLSGTDMAIDGWGMFQTLALILFLPVGLYAFTAKFLPKTVPVIRKNSSFAAVILIGSVVFMIVSSQQDIILKDLWFLLEAVSVGVCAYAGLYFGGWFIFRNKPFRERVSYAFICGNNNIAIGISLAFLYLPEREIVTLVSWEIAWLSGMVLFQSYLAFQAKRSAR